MKKERDTNREKDYLLVIWKGEAFFKPRPLGFFFSFAGRGRMAERGGASRRAAPTGGINKEGTSVPSRISSLTEVEPLGESNERCTY